MAAEKTCARYEVLLGPNTNQWWVYDNENDVYIDPPKSVLDEAKAFFSDDLRKQYIQDVTGEEPSWLNDKMHWYKDLEP